jgi:hypothetical protein
MIMCVTHKIRLVTHKEGWEIFLNHSRQFEIELVSDCSVVLVIEHCHRMMNVDD